MNTEANSSTILEIKNLSVAYRTPYYYGNTARDIFVQALSSPITFFTQKNEQIIILRNINLTLKSGDRLGIFGNNGCGKTTLCRCIAGLGGKQKTIKVNGDIRSIFDTEVAILPELSGRENLEILTHLFFGHFGPKERIEIMNDAIEFAELGKYIDVPYKLYSKGMRARLCLSLISARRADLLILDEVFNGADHFFSEKITNRIKSLIYNSGAVIFVSHTQELIHEICNRAIVLDHKQIVFDGDPKEASLYYLKNCQRTNIENR